MKRPRLFAWAGRGSWLAINALKRQGRQVFVEALVASLGIGCWPACGGDGSTTNLADLSVEQLMEVSVDTVSGASRYAQKVTQAPASVSIVTGEEIQKLGYRTLADVLDGVRGLHVTYDRNYAYLGVRGFGRPGDYNSRVLLLVDGHRLNDNIYDQASIGTEGIVDVDLIERVEIIRGPSSSLYGDSAFFGVVNVITKRGGQLNGAEASVEAGSFNTYKGRFSFGRKFGEDWELLLSGSWYDSAGSPRLYYPQFDQAATDYGVARNSDGDSYQNFYGSLRWKEWTLSSGFVNRLKDVPTASYDTVFNSRLEDTRDTRGYVDLRFEHDLSGSTRLMARGFYDVYSYYGHYPYDATNEALPLHPVQVIVNQDEALGEWAGTEWQLTQRVCDRHVLVGGVTYREDVRQLQRNFFYEPGFSDVRIEHGGRIVGLYGEAEIGLLTNLTFDAGLRYDHYDTFGGTVNPRLGLVYSPWETSTFKLLYGRAFRAPNAYELYYEAPGYNRSNPNLAPETINTYELVYEQSLPANLRLSASGYYYEIHNLISQQADELGQIFYANVQEVRATGLELELEHRSTCGLLGRLSYACQRAVEAGTGEELDNSPRHLAKLNLIVPVYWDKVFAGLELLYTSRVRTLADTEASQFVTANLTLFGQRILKNLDLSASIYNLLDTKYGYPGGQELRQDVVEQDGRSFRVKLTYRF